MRSKLEVNEADDVRQYSRVLATLVLTIISAVDEKKPPIVCVTRLRTPARERYTHSSDRPNSTWLVSTRLDTTRHVLLCRASRDERVERVEPYCSNMTDDEQATVLACTSSVVFMLLHTHILFVSSNEIN